MAKELKVHLLSPSGRVVCQSPKAALTTRKREEVTCGRCRSMGVRAPRS